MICRYYTFNFIHKECKSTHEAEVAANVVVVGHPSLIMLQIPVKLMSFMSYRGPARQPRQMAFLPLFYKKVSLADRWCNDP